MKAFRNFPSKPYAGSILTSPQTYRKPLRADEHQLYYFASKDMGVSHSLARRFFWFENIIWKQDLKDIPVTVSLGGRDLIVDARTVRAYLLRDEEKACVHETGSGSEDKYWKKTGFNLLWYDGPQVFDKTRTRAQLVRVIRTYCSRI